jgi:gluconokinase
MTATLDLGKSVKQDVAVAAMKPDEHGLTILPFLSGERSPGWQGHARATIHGLSLATTPLEILRAGMEAVAYRVAIVFEKIAGLLPADPRVIASGGALYHSASWTQIMSDVLGRPMALSGVREASARGVALLAFEALGLVDHLENIPECIEKRYQPDLSRHALYRKAIERQQDLYETVVKGEYHAKK